MNRCQQDTLSCGYVEFCLCDVDDADRHLLKRAVLLDVSQHPGPHIRNVLCEQGMHQTHEFASGEDEGTLVLILGHFAVLAPVESLILEIELAEGVGSQDQVVAQVLVADLGEPGVLRDKVARGALLPGDA